MAIVRNKLRDQVIDHILDTVRNEHLEIGDSLPPERELSETLQVSRTVVREALTGLEMQGMLEMIPGRRPTLAHRYEKAIGYTLRLAIGDDARSLSELGEVRRIFEPEVAALAASNATALDLNELRAVHDAMAVNLENRSGYVEADYAFHDRLLTAANNRVLANIIRPVGEILLHSRELTSWKRRPTRDALLEHETVLRAVEAGDSKLARVTMSAHIASTLEDLQAFLETDRSAE